MSDPEKKKWPLAMAEAVALRLAGLLGPYCERVEVAGSIRRRKALVGDVELVFIPKLRVARDAGALFAEVVNVDMADEELSRLLGCGVIGKRLNVNGSPAWGVSNKLGVDVLSGIPVDFFSTTEDAWWNTLVSRTGGAISNTQIAGEAKARGWKWCPMREGFERRSGPDRGRMVAMHSEREVFEFVKMPYLAPEARL